MLKSFLLFTFLYTPILLAAANINIYISSDWEGMHLDSYNIKAMRNFNQNYPNVGITHFLNAAYFTKKNLSSSKIKNMINMTIKTKDSLGLHIHGWKSLFENSGVKYKNSPSWEPNYHCNIERLADCGHDIPISIYPKHDLKKVIKNSVAILKQNGFYPLNSFRAGGWMANSAVLEALSEEGISIDSSAVDARLLSKKLPRGRKFNFLDMLLPIWPNTNWSSQPYIIKVKSKKILEYPNNGLFSDYLSTEEMFKIYLANIELMKKRPSKDFTISYGFHQETADRYLIRIEKLIDKIRKHSRENKISIKFLTL